MGSKARELAKSMSLAFVLLDFQQAGVRRKRAYSVSMHGRGHVWPWLTEFSGVALSCFTLSRLAIFTDVSLIEPEK